MSDKSTKGTRRGAGQDARWITGSETARRPEISLYTVRSVAAANAIRTRRIAGRSYTQYLAEDVARVARESILAGAADGGGGTT